jgi:hypothetical protein
MTSFCLYLGLLLSLIGAVSLVRPLAFLQMRTRRRGAAVVLAGLALVAGAAIWPARVIRSTGSATRMDELMPAYQFHEVHSLLIRASPAEAFRAIKAVTPGEIRYLRTLMAIRNLPQRLVGGGRPPSAVAGYTMTSYTRGERESLTWTIDVAATRRIAGRGTTIEYALKRGGSPTRAPSIVAAYAEAIRRRGGSELGRDSCCRALFVIAPGPDTVWIGVVAREDGLSFRLTILEPGDSRSEDNLPIVDLFTHSGFLVLVEEPGRELVLGTVNRYWPSAAGPASPRLADAREFVAFSRPDYAKVAFNLRIEDRGGGRCRVTTETRILGTDPSAGRKFAAYWRVIYPGSAIIRRSLLDAIRRRAERGA